MPYRTSCKIGYTGWWKAMKLSNLISIQNKSIPFYVDVFVSMALLLSCGVINYRLLITLILLNFVSVNVIFVQNFQDFSVNFCEILNGFITAEN